MKWKNLLTFNVEYRIVECGCTGNSALETRKTFQGKEALYTAESTMLCSTQAVFDLHEDPE
jgi:hypothetical protein